MAKDRLVITDLELKDPLCRYFNYKNIEFDILPTEYDVPLVDILADKIKGKSDVVLILGIQKKSNGFPSSMKQLYEQVSVYNDFRKLRQDITLIIYNEFDVMCNLIANRRTDFGFSTWLNDLKPLILVDGRMGVNLRNDYKDCEFVELIQPFLQDKTTYPELSTEKNHKPTMDYLCLMADKTNRPFRRLLNEKIIANGIQNHMIYSFKEKIEGFFDDLRNCFSQRVVDSLQWKDGFPLIDYYNQTNLELSVESLCSDHDETFFITEKTTKPIAMKHPFMILSNKDFLKNLRALGFKTFHEHIDESYDTEPMVAKRVEIIVKNLIELRGQTHKLYMDTQIIRDYNHLHLQHQAGEWRTKFWRTMDEIWRNI